ncbi:MAG: UDP-N-acetylmuramate dehydrogenase [Clostridiales bacterium]|nr:UDP-N-acetylmuramate dehydrogenase [Clostridiales bacterium]
METIIEKLREILEPDQIIENADMAQHTSFKAGGCADVLVCPSDAEQLQQVLAVLSDVPHMVLGNGSNVLVRDGGYRGVIVKIGEHFNYIRREGNKLICGAGALMSAVAKKAASEGLSGFEFASGIPGSIGGAVFMNAGAYGGETKDILEEAHVIAADGSGQSVMTAEDLQMGYRHTVLHETGDVVTEVILKLEEGDEAEIRERMSELTKQRNAKQPVQYPSAGSFFKRPEGYFAGKLVQDAGCKGLSVGGAEVSPLHSGFIINKGGATATDITQLKELVQARVFDKFGVMLEPEVRIIGEEPDGAADAVSGEPVGTVDDYVMTYDLHTHTTYSHGTGSVEDNVKVAVEKGLEFIAISDHGPGHLFYGIKRNEIPNFKKDVEQMAEKYPQISVRASVEANILHAEPGTDHANGLDVKPEEFKDFDFIIAGFHFGCTHCSSIKNWLWSHGIKAGEENLRKSNTKMITDALRLNDIAILTHPGDKGPFDILEIAKVCAETNTLIEINGRHNHLTVDEIKEAMQVEGLNFIISSDAHSPDAVGSYKASLQRALDAGLDISRIVNIRRDY